MRRAGVGSDLVADVEVELRAKRCAALETHVAVGREGVRRLLLAEGVVWYVRQVTELSEVVANSRAVGLVSETAVEVEEVRSMARVVETSVSCRPTCWYMKQQKVQRKGQVTRRDVEMEVEERGNFWVEGGR